MNPEDEIPEVLHNLQVLLEESPNASPEDVEAIFLPDYSQRNDTFSLDVYMKSIDEEEGEEIAAAVTLAAGLGEEELEKRYSLYRDFVEENFSFDEIIGFEPENLEEKIQSFDW